MIKCNTNYALTHRVRASEKFLTPKNIILKLLIFLAVFYIAQLAEVVVIVPFAMPDFIAWATQRMEEVGTLDEAEIMEKITNLMLDPSMTKVMLYATIPATLLIFLFCRLIEGRKLSTLGFRKPHAVQQYFAGLAVGFALFSLILALSLCMGGLTWNGLQSFSVPGLLVMLGGWLFQGMSEEVICRGYLMTTILRHHKPIWAVFINSVLFGVMHVENAGFSIPAMMNLTLFGVMISLYVLRTDNLWGACAIHSIWNFVQGNFYGLPVSGIAPGDTVFATSLVEGKNLANGGEFGLEASVPCAIVLSMMILILLFLPLPFLDKHQDDATNPADTEAAA